jgi:hypothetical protein
MLRYCVHFVRKHFWILQLDGAELGRKVSYIYKVIYVGYELLICDYLYRSNSYMLAFYGIVFSMVQARGVHKLTTKYGVLKLLKYSLPILAISYFASAFTS